MVYSNKYVLSILVNGKVQQELHNGEVRVPFGCEYTIRLRNKNSVRAVAKILIDGENVSGNGYIIPANSYEDIKRHAEVDRAFKFVALDSAEAVDFGKNGPNDDKSKGVIEVRFHAEIVPVNPVIVDHHHYHPLPWHYYGPRPIVRRIQTGVSWTKGFPSTTAGLSSQPSLQSMVSTQTSDAPAEAFNSASLSCSAEVSVPKSALFESLEGCTVEGNQTGQTFVSRHIAYEDQFTSMKVFLRGIPEKAPAKVSSSKVEVPENISISDAEELKLLQKQIEEKKANLLKKAEFKKEKQRLLDELAALEAEEKKLS